MDAGLPLLLCFALGVSSCWGLELHFDKPESGFFTQELPLNDATLLKVKDASKGPKDDEVLSSHRFTVVQPDEPATLTASYGPFTTKQTIPAKYVVLRPEDMDPDNSSKTPLSYNKEPTNIDISAHLITPHVYRDNPVLRVLFHTGRSLMSLEKQRSPWVEKLCVNLMAAPKEESKSIPLAATCTPDVQTGTCLGELTLPPYWWPPETEKGTSGGNEKPWKSPIRVWYSVYESPHTGCEKLMPRVVVQPLTYLDDVILLPWKGKVEEVTEDEILRLLMPSTSLYPKSRVYIPVLVTPGSSPPLNSFTVRVRVKSGLKVLGGGGMNPEHWNVSMEIHPKGTVGLAHAQRRFDVSPQESLRRGVHEVFAWLVEARGEDEDGDGDTGRMVWSVTYHSGPDPGTVADAGDGPDPADGGGGPGLADADADSQDGLGKRRFIAQLSLQKDDVQILLPIARSWELVNVGVLTGRQVSMPMKVYLVSQAGKVADVTLQSSCSSPNDSHLKVSSSCTSVYVDGSEAGGSENATIRVTYGTYEGYGRFRVWSPQLPLVLLPSDPRLSVVKSWRAPVLAKRDRKKKQKKTEKKKGGLGEKETEDLLSNRVLGDARPGNGDEDEEDRVRCQLRYQQASVRVYAQFKASDQNSGRETYFLSRQTLLDVTDLVTGQLMLTDNQIASLDGSTITGLQSGTTNIQVMSPMTTGKVLGSTEIRIGKEKVSIEGLDASIVTGLNLDIRADPKLENGHLVDTLVERTLTAKYQEGLLDIRLRFSDGTTLPIEEVDPDDYSLDVETLAPSVVAYAPSVTHTHPRVIAVGSGSGKLLKVSLRMGEKCQKRGKEGAGPVLVSALVAVRSQIQGNDGDIIQNDSGLKDEQRNPVRGTMVSNKPDEGKKTWLIEPIFKLNPTGSGEPQIVPSGNHGHGAIGSVTTLEVGMYVLLAVFVLAILVFVAACIVYASRFKRKLPPHSHEETVALNPAGHQQQMTSPHDWVYLGRSTFDRSSTSGMSQLGSIPRSGHHPRITPNPLPPPPPIDHSHTCSSWSASSATNATYMDDPPRSVNVLSNPLHAEQNPSYHELPRSGHLRRTRVPVLPPLPSSDPSVPPPVPPHRVMDAATNTTMNRHGVKVLPEPYVQHARRVPVAQMMNADARSGSPLLDDLPDPSAFPSPGGTFRKPGVPHDGLPRPTIDSDSGRSYPMPSYPRPNGTLTFKSFTNGMSKEQLVDYIDGLKESVA